MKDPNGHQMTVLEGVKFQIENTYNKYTVINNKVLNESV